MKEKKVLFESQTPETSVPHVQTDSKTGLTAAQVKAQRDAGNINTAVAPPTKTVSEIIKENLFTYFNLVFIVLAVLVMAAGSFRSLTFMPVVIANALIGIIQELRAKQALDKLTVLSVPKAVVIRDSKRQEILVEELVLNDLVIFRAGDQISADAVILSGEVSANEALLTGEQDEVAKRPGDALMSGSFLVSGECRAQLTRVGAESYVSKLTLEARAMDKKQQSEMLRILDRLVGIVGIAIIPIGVLLFWQQYVQAGAGFRDSIVSMVAAIVGMIPEGLYLLTSVALAVSVVRLSKQRVLVRNMKCIETLARVDVLCVDKTGTITQPAMQVSAAVPLPGYDPSTMPNLKALLSDFASAMPADNLTMQAIKEHFVTPSKKKPTAIVPFSSACKYSAAAFGESCYVLGAPELVLREAYDEVKSLVENYSADGNRVLVFARYEGTPDGTALTGKATGLALVLLVNPIRKEARETFQYFAGQGVAIKVISGDNPVTVSQIAREAGIAGAENYVDASALQPEEIAGAVERYTVFGRVTPEQKRQFVQALKKAGHTVGMTGDGVNDILALKDADCSVAMASGCDAASQVSQLVLLDSDFSCMPSVVAEGRRVVNNIERSASLFLVKNIFSFLMAVFSVCFQLSYPLEPAQISLISTFTIGIPAFLLALQPNPNIIKGHFLGNVLIKALPAGITDFLVVGALVVFGQVFAVEPSDISIACTLLLAIVGFMILYNISKPMDCRRWAIWGVSVLGLLGSSIFLGDLFGIARVTPRCAMLFVIFAIVTEPILRYGTLFVEKIGNSIIRCKEKRRLKKSKGAKKSVKPKKLHKIEKGQ